METDGLDGPLHEVERVTQERPGGGPEPGPQWPARETLVTQGPRRMDAAALAEAERRLQEAETGPPGPRAEAALTVGILRWARDGYAEAIDALDEAVRAAKLHGEPSLLARALMERAAWLWHSFRVRSARSACDEAIASLPPGEHDELRALALEQRACLASSGPVLVGDSDPPPTAAEAKERRPFVDAMLESREELRRRAPADDPESLADLIFAHQVAKDLVGKPMPKSWQDECAGLRLLPWQGARRPSQTLPLDCRLFVKGMKTEYLAALIALRTRELAERPFDVELGIALHRILLSAGEFGPDQLVTELDFSRDLSCRWRYFWELSVFPQLVKTLHRDTGRYEAASALACFKVCAVISTGSNAPKYWLGLHRRDGRELVARFEREPARLEANQAATGLRKRVKWIGSDYTAVRLQQGTLAKRARATTDARTAHAEAAEMLQELRGFFAPGSERRAGVPRMLQRIARLFTARWGWARSLRMIRRAVAMHRRAVEANESDDLELLSGLLLDEARLHALLRAYGPAQRALLERDELDRRALANGDVSAEERMCATEVERALLELRRRDPVPAVKRLRATLERSHPTCRGQPRSCHLVREHVELSLLLAAACRRAGDATGWAVAREEAVTVGARFHYPRAADRLHAEILRGHRGRFHVTAAAVLSAETSSLTQA